MNFIKKLTPQYPFLLLGFFLSFLIVYTISYFILPGWGRGTVWDFIYSPFLLILVAPLTFPVLVAICSRDFIILMALIAVFVLPIVFLYWGAKVKSSFLSFLFAMISGTLFTSCSVTSLYIAGSGA